MTYCSKCKKNIGFLSAKRKLDNGSILCASCYEKWVEEQRIMMMDYISNYISKKYDGINGYILGCYKNKEIYELFAGDYLDKPRTHFKNLFDAAENSNHRGLSSDQIDELIETKKMCEVILDFLEDLGKIYKIFHKKGIDISYQDILYFFSEVMDKSLNEKYEECLAPAKKIIKERLGNKITIEGVVGIFLRLPLDITNNSEYVYKILDSLNLEYEKYYVEQLIEEVREEVNLEKFERDLGTNKSIVIGDFDRLIGHEFESYLKNLFELIGYTVIRTSLSGDQGADLIISKDGKKTVVQAKKYSEKVSNKAVQEVVAAKNHYRADDAIVVTNNYFTKSAIDLALSNDVELWDGMKLKRIIKELKSKNEKGDATQFEMSLKVDKKGKVKIACPLCEKEFEHEINKKDEGFEVQCPHCNISLKVKELSRSWTCKRCSRKFENKEEAEKHEKKCT